MRRQYPNVRWARVSGKDSIADVWSRYLPGPSTYSQIAPSLP